ncbi:hypothetical protein, partial [Borborobacter arsenicus]|uniref:hypothetical protein n=1 Tax=Borborobacter arsenicus TaxID=1851146 RepID=UPI001AED09CC
DAGNTFRRPNVVRQPTANPQSGFKHGRRLNPQGLMRVSSYANQDILCKVRKHYCEPAFGRNH